MKKLTALVLVLASAVALRANSFTFIPNPANLSDLSHSYAFTWGINGWDETNLKTQLLSTSDPWKISSVTLSFSHIYNWDRLDTGNQLFIHLLDNPRVGVKSYSDDPADGGINQGTVSDYFSGNITSNHGAYYGSVANQNNGNSTNIFLEQYHDEDGPLTKPNLTYDLTSFSSTFENYIKNGHTGDTSTIKYADFGLGFDPDCHYYNCGVVLNITTSRVPDSGATMILLGAGLLALCGVGLVLQRRSRKA
jgi:hypothetical protein